MAQRLTINLNADGERIAGMSFKWGAYTDVALNILDGLCKDFQSEKKKAKFYQELAVRLAEKLGAGVTDKERFLIEKEYPDGIYGVRLPEYQDGQGILLLSHEGLDSLRGTSVRTITLDMVQETIDFDVYDWTDMQTYLDERAAFFQENDMEDPGETLQENDFRFRTVRIKDYKVFGKLVRDYPEGYICPGYGVFRWIM